ncbi:hypothetical protein MPTK1_8g07730 [Marchantia polymorpha subsp. ruderalis]|uniref:Uncharacterized protein n=1 Tax=Marchantia polymorpha TaxID=3197 RepID=A0A2R6XI44_MARPO|nr:hypothetical protein MARPO_0013s0022 [Marchantia polymorpha]BBN19082.1 hypothetical protein Mp_8g07730 [Marchantia polymorpha subsp. ruderalis]|eukprot:PTQ45764.1 hypothetical protein MARPO_0013s0022 [Marchantia polymorpha]
MRCPETVGGNLQESPTPEQEAPLSSQVQSTTAEGGFLQHPLGRLPSSRRLVISPERTAAHGRPFLPSFRFVKSFCGTHPYRALKPSQAHESFSGTDRSFRSWPARLNLGLHTERVLTEIDIYTSSHYHTYSSPGNINYSRACNSSLQLLLKSDVQDRRDLNVRVELTEPCVCHVCQSQSQLRPALCFQPFSVVENGWNGKEE